jgi:uncharacterized protein (TIGR03067 family)
MSLRTLALTAIVLAGAGWAAAQNGDKDLEKLQGRWVTEKSEKEGTAEFKFEKNKFTILIDGKDSYKGTFKIDASKKPKQMDLTVTEGEKFKDETSLALYQIEGDTLKWCAGEPGKKDRPKEFPEKQGDSKYLYLVLKRAK